MFSLKRCVQWCFIGLVVFSPDLFPATGFIVSDHFGCATGDGFNNHNRGERTFNFDFSTQMYGWVGGFADYPLGQEGFYELLLDFRPLLPALNPNRTGLFISGNNHSDDLFMFVKRQITGLSPHRAYQVNFDIEIGSEAGSDCLGAGGSPAIALKAGASVIEPAPQVDANGLLRMNIDKGNQGIGGRNAEVLGDIGVDVDCANPVFKAKRLQSSTGDLFEVTTDGSGSMWLIVGTDSSFEGVTRLFYTNIAARFSLQ
jgi:hypothetical protein